MKKMQSGWHGLTAEISVFFYFLNNKTWFFTFLIKLIWMGIYFLNRTGAEIGENEKKCKEIIFYHWKKLKNTESAQLWG